MSLSFELSDATIYYCVHVANLSMLQIFRISEIQARHAYFDNQFEIKQIWPKMEACILVWIKLGDEHSKTKFTKALLHYDQLQLSPNSEDQVVWHHKCFVNYVQGIANLLHKQVMRQLSKKGLPHARAIIKNYDKQYKAIAGVVVENPLYLKLRYDDQIKQFQLRVYDENLSNVLEGESAHHKLLATSTIEIFVPNINIFFKQKAAGWKGTFLIGESEQQSVPCERNQYLEFLVQTKSPQVVQILVHEGAEKANLDNWEHDLLVVVFEQQYFSQEIKLISRLLIKNGTITSCLILGKEDNLRKSRSIPQLLYQLLCKGEAEMKHQIHSMGKEQYSSQLAQQNIKISVATLREREKVRSQMISYLQLPEVSYRRVIHFAQFIFFYISFNLQNQLTGWVIEIDEFFSKHENPSRKQFLRCFVSRVAVRSNKTFSNVDPWGQGFQIGGSNVVRMTLLSSSVGEGMNTDKLEGEDWSSKNEFLGREKGIGDSICG